MGRAADFGIAVVSGYAVARRSHKQAAASEAANEAAWQQAYAQMEHEADLAHKAAAEAVRDEIRHQAELARRATWMSRNPIGEAWRAATMPGMADEHLAKRIEVRNVAWRKAWARQCDQDGLGPVATRTIRGLWLVRALMSVVLPLAGVAVLLFALNTGAWLINHSWFTPPTRFYGGETLPNRGTRDLLTPGLAVGAYVAAALAVLAYAAGNALDFRTLRVLRRAGSEAVMANEKRAQVRSAHYGFDPLAASMPSQAHWAVLADGSDPEQALYLLAVVDPRRMRGPERMTMAHVNKMQAVAAWQGRVRPDTPSVLPPGMRAQLERMRHA